MYDSVLCSLPLAHLFGFLDSILSSVGLCRLLCFLSECNCSAEMVNKQVVTRVKCELHRIHLFVVTTYTHLQ